MSRSTKFITLVTVAGLLFIVILFALRWQPVSGNLPPAAQQTPQPDLPSRDEILAAELRSALIQENLSSASRESLQEKLEMAERLQEQRAPETNLPRDGKPGLGRPPIPDVQALGVPQQESQDEIIEGSEGLVHTWEADIINLWQGERDGVFYQVLAGAAPDNPTQGLVVIIATNRASLDTSQTYILAPDQPGALRVEEMRGTMLILSAQNRETLKFDILSGQFIP